MQLQVVQIAIPERLGGIVAEAAARVAGGATLFTGALGWWTNGAGEIEREKISWLIVGVEKKNKERLISTIKEILKSGGESAIFYIIGSKARLEWL
jgi:hypothetical protein